MTQVFAAICIGGPVAGQIMVSHGPTLEVHHRTRLPRGYLMGDAVIETQKARIRRWVYRYDDMTATTPVWRPIGWSSQEVIDFLLKSYKPRLRKKKK